MRPREVRRSSPMNIRLLPALALLLGFTLARPAHAGDTRYRDHMRNARYGEIVVVTGGPFRFVGMFTTRSA